MSHLSNYKFDLTKTDRKLGILIDPDEHSESGLENFIKRVLKLKPDYILIGGSLIHESSIQLASQKIKTLTQIPLLLFPGHFNQLNNSVDAVLLLSLISGRNPDLLIGQHVLAAPILAKMGVDIISTGYMLIDGGCPTSVSYISNTLPIPRDKEDIAMCTALAGEFIGMKTIYLDAGSGAINSVPLKMVEKVSNKVSIPLIVGGGIKDLGLIETFWEAGANLVIIGNALEERPSLIKTGGHTKSQL